MAHPTASRLWPLTLLLALVPLLTQAETRYSERVDDYTIHFNAITTDKLHPDVARAYDIRRSGNRAVVTVSVLKDVMGAPAEPVPARVTGGWRNLVGHASRLRMREVKDGAAIYYIDTLSVQDEDTVTFNLNIRPQGAERDYEVDFRRRFYTE